MLLAVETSCDETAVALFDSAVSLSGGRASAAELKAELISSQAKLHAAYGGVVPELASREHVKNLPLVVNDVCSRANVSLDDVSVVAVTAGPGLKGCLLVGLSWAKAFAWAKGIPLIAINHLEGHLYAAELLAEEDRPKYPRLSLLVSGGHTYLIFEKRFRDYQVVAQTRDDAAGEAFDKSATLLNLPYPGGPALSKLAEQGNPQAFSFPKSMSNDPTSFSFSGLKTAVLRCAQKLKEQIQDEQTRADLAASIQEAIVTDLIEKTRTACLSHRPASLQVTGGVAANRRLRERLAALAAELNLQFCAVPPKWCTDNASMIGILALRIIEQNPKKFSQWKSSTGSELGPELNFDVGAKARWPIAA